MTHTRSEVQVVSTAAAVRDLAPLSSCVSLASGSMHLGWFPVGLVRDLR